MINIKVVNINQIDNICLRLLWCQQRHNEILKRRFLVMKNKRKMGISKTNFWAEKENYVSKRSAQNFLNPMLRSKVTANCECQSGCNNSCGTACATGCTDF